jgi:hypothetical protein
MMTFGVLWLLVATFGKYVPSHHWESHFGENLFRKISHLERISGDDGKVDGMIEGQTCMSVECTLVMIKHFLMLLCFVMAVRL